MACILSSEYQNIDAVTRSIFKIYHGFAKLLSLFPQYPAAVSLFKIVPRLRSVYPSLEAVQDFSVIYLPLVKRYQCPFFCAQKRSSAEEGSTASSHGLDNPASLGGGEF